jgi:UDP-N-acetylglucosamine:LPS N-acetylglucosamine transferase
MFNIINNNANNNTTNNNTNNTTATGNAVDTVNNITAINNTININTNTNNTTANATTITNNTNTNTNNTHNNDINSKKELNIAIACEIAPAKTLIPIIKKLKELEELKKLGKLNELGELDSKNHLKWDKINIIALVHGNGVEELIEPYVDNSYSIGEGRKAGNIKRNNFELAYLIAKDTIKAIKALKGKNIDLLITCGNAGDVRKSIIAANLLKIPILHIEQDIYNPIETIAYANFITLPSKKYQDYFKNFYDIDTNITTNIHGYPMASYIHELEINEKSTSETELKLKNGFEDFILIVLGGDIKQNQIKDLIEIVEKSDIPTFIAPYRFKKEFIESLISSEKAQIKVLDEFVDLLPLMKSAIAIIYAAGMGMTIEAGVLEIPSIKISGFHKNHGSVDLSKFLNIPVVEIEDLSEKIAKITELNIPNGKKLLKSSEIAIDNIIKIINRFDSKNLPKKPGLNSMKAIWKKRSEFK